MSTVTTLPTRHTYTVADLATMPDDGNRYELLDGTLIVTPAPATAHQRASFRLGMVLGLACPAALEVLAAPLDVRLSSDTLVQPDLLVVDPAHLDDAGLAGVPLLAVEILSPSTRLLDLDLKKSRYEAAGCPSYWAVDPGLGGGPPALTVWELDGSGYAHVGHAEGEQTLHVDEPFPVDITPARLV